MSLDRKALIERKKVLQSQPLTKWISVIETDGLNTVKKKHLVRFKQTKDIDHLKSDLTNSLKPSIGPFRHIYTPAGGTEVTSLDQIQKDKEYVFGQGNQNFKKLSQVLNNGKQQEANRRKKQSTTNSSSSLVSQTVDSENGKRRLTLMERQDLIAQQAKDSRKGSQASMSSETAQASVMQLSKSNNFESKFLARKFKKPLNRKPLYPGGGPKKDQQGDTEIKGNFVRASRLSQMPVAVASQQSLEASESPQRSETSVAYSREHSGYTSPERSQHTGSPGESYLESPGRSPERSQHSRSPGESYIESPARSESPDYSDEEYSQSPSLQEDEDVVSTRRGSWEKPRPGTYGVTRSKLGSAGSSSHKSSNGSPAFGTDDVENVSQKSFYDSFGRQSAVALGNSLGQRILKTATSTNDQRRLQSTRSIRTEDYIDRDEDDVKNFSHRTLRYGTSFDEDAAEAETTHNMTVTSQGHGVDNNDAFVAMRSRQQSRGSLFSYKLASDSPKRETKTR